MKYDTREDYEDYIFNDYADIEAEESFEDILEKYGTELDEARKMYAEFMEWYEGMLERTGAVSRHKASVCLDLIKYAESRPAHEDIIKLWCVCVSEENDFLFVPEGDERCELAGFLRLKADIEDYSRRIGSEKQLRESFRQTAGNISFCSEPVEKADISRLYHAFCIDGGLKGPYLKDNLEYVNEMICRSPELVRLAPLVYYSLFSRYRKKLLDTMGYEPNFGKLLRRMEYVIDTDNGKNIDTFGEHTAIYRCACCFCGNNFDKALCDAGFGEMSNIVQCRIVAEENFDGIVLPLKDELAGKYFTAFPRGLDENPVFLNTETQLEELIRFEQTDEDRIGSLKITPKIRKYLEQHHEISHKYTDLIRAGRQSECMPLVFEVVDNSGVKDVLRKACTVDVLNVAIIEELHSHTSERIRRGLEEMLDRF